MVKEKSSENIFSKFYNNLESRYIKFSDWLTKKGIPLNDFNNYLEEKGLPAFAIVASLLLLLLFIIFFLIFFSFSNQAQLTFNFRDFQGTSVTNVSLTISDSKKEIFSEVVENNSTEKIKLKVGEVYSFKAIKDGYPEILENIEIVSKEQIVNLIFSENVEFGILKIKLKDRENQKIIGSGTAKVNYTINNKPESKEANVDIYNNHFITLEVPMYKDLEILIYADNYEDYKEENYRLNSTPQEKIIELDVASLSFQGESKVTFIVVDKENNLLDDAQVIVYNISEQEIANQKTVDGKAIVYINSGETISYIVKKEGFKTFVSDINISTRITKFEESFTVILDVGGNFVDVFVKSSTNYLGLEDVLINLYNKDNVLIDSGKTPFSGELKFEGINIDHDLLITACKETYFCENLFIDLEQETRAEFTLEKIEVTNSSILNIFVVDEKNLPVSNASVKIYTLIEEGEEVKEIPYNTNLTTDLTGGLSIPLKVDNKFRVYAFVGESMLFEDITISQLKENKIIFVMDSASKLFKLDLYDENGNKINSGHLLVKTKDGTVLYDGNISFGEDVIFNSQGYKDFIAEYTGQDGEKSYINFNSDQAESDGYIKLDFSKEANTTDYPIIEFVGITNQKGVKTNFLTVGENYYLIFDVLFPENVFNGEVHVRAGDDTQVDSEEMGYGINGFLAIDATSFRYGTTYNNKPEPGMQGTDFLNQGSFQILNKWLEIKWSSSRPLSNKQIKVKVKATDPLDKKLTFKYRVLYHENDLYFRDPIDPILNQEYTNNRRSALYAQTKEVVVDLFNVPLNCNDDFCVSYSFLDNKNNSFTRENFYAIKDSEYVLKADIYSIKNTQINLTAETLKSFPLISFNNFSDNPQFTNITNIDNLEVSRENLSIPANSLKEVYLSFIAKEIGSAYIDLKAKDVISQEPFFNDRISFNIYNQKEMNVTIDPQFFISFGGRFTVSVNDSATGDPITDAFITFYNDRGQLISSIKGQGSLGRDGKYSIDNKFNFSKIEMVVESYGYIPYREELYIVDDSIFLINPSEVLINLGLDQMIKSESFTINNNSEYVGQNISFGSPVWLDGPSDIFLDFRGPLQINRNSKQEFDVTVTVSNDLKFNTAYGYVPISINIGSREISKVLKLRINKGLTVSDCVKITPGNVNSFVGLNLKYTPPDFYKMEYRDYDYSQRLQNPMLSPYQQHTSYDDYLDSAGYNQQYTSLPNTRIFSDQYHTHYSTIPTSNVDGSQNTTYFVIENSCGHDITFNPQSVLESSSSNQELEISLAPVTVLAGEVKNYDVIIKNKSDRRSPTKYKYNVLWHNNFYSLSPSVLNVDVLDLTKSLIVSQSPIFVDISQLHPQQSTNNTTRFDLINIGTVPVTDIQIGQYPKMFSSNIQITPYPLEIPVLEPGRAVPIDLHYKVNLAQTTLDDALIYISGRVPGYNNPVSTQTLLKFRISAPNCLKVSPKQINFSASLGDVRKRNITITNTCAEPVIISRIDKTEGVYQETFGNNPFRIYPASGLNYLLQGQDSSYTLKLTARNLGGSPNMPMTIIGRLQESGLDVSSEQITMSIELKDPSFEEERDREVSKIVSLGYCEDIQEMDSFSAPIISTTECSEISGYCDSETSSKFILKKLNELSSQIKQASSQAQAKVLNTGCTLGDVSRGFCKISEIGGGVDPLEFTFYMQNDQISIEQFKNILQKTNYSFKNYFVEPNSFDTTSNNQGVYLGGNKIFLSNKFKGCGKYTVQIDGFIAASQDVIYPERAYFYINVIKSEKTEHCEKNILNYLNFLPWDLSLHKNNRQGTWLTLFSGDENISKSLIKSIGKFGKEPDLRYVYQREISSAKNNMLHVLTGEITENPEALAKISFNDLKLYQTSNPEQINILLNNKYAQVNNQIPEKVERDFVNIISSMIVKNDISLKACVSKDKDYMLILDTIDAGDFIFTSKNPSISLNEGQSCSTLKIKSSVDEVARLSSGKIEGLEVGFKENENDSLKETININVLENKESEVLFCVRPLITDNISYFVGNKINVKADSIYSQKGTIGNRSTDVDVTLSTCAITPEQFLLESYNVIVTEHFKEEDKREFGQNITALVDWQDSYSRESKEDLCSALEKFVNNSSYDEKLFFNYESINCDIRDVSSKTESQINKGLLNAGGYFGRCAAACSVCYGLSALVLPTTIMGALVDCVGLSCGIPSLGIFLSTLTGGHGIGDGIDKLVGYVVASDDFKMFGPLFEKIEHLVVGTLGSLLTGTLKSASMAASAPLNATESAVLSQAPTYLPSAPLPASGGGGVVVVGGLSGSGITNFNNQFNNFMRYFSGTDSIKFNAASATDQKILNNLYGKMNTAPGTPLEKLGVLSNTEVDDLIRITKNGKASGGAGFGFVRPDTFANKLTSAKVNLGYTGGAGGAAGAAGGAGAAAATGSLLDSTEFNALSKTIDDQLSAVDKSIKELESKVADLKKNADRSSINPRKVRTSPNLTGYEKDLASQKQIKASLEKVKTGLKNATPEGGNYRIPSEITKEIDDLATKNMSLKSTSKFKTRLRGIGGFARGFTCGVLGNLAGINWIKKSAYVNLKHAIEFENSFDFERNIFYVAHIDYIEPEDNSFDHRYLISIYPYGSKDSSQNLSEKTTRVDKCILDAN